MSSLLFMMLLGAAGSQVAVAADTGQVNPCDQWGRIDAVDSTVGEVGGVVLNFEVLGTACPGVDVSSCRWQLDPNGGSMGELSATNGASIQWRTPTTLDVCPPIEGELEVRCDESSGDQTIDFTTLTVEDSNNTCSPSGGGCISPRQRGAWLVFPLLFLGGGIRRRS